MAKKKKIERCIDCGEKTSNFYIYSINKGKIVRCSECHELNVIRSTKFDSKIMDGLQIKDLTRE